MLVLLVVQVDEPQQCVGSTRHEVGHVFEASCSLFCCEVGSLCRDKYAFVVDWVVALLSV